MTITRVSPPPNMSMTNTSVWRDWYSKVHTLLNYISASNTSLGQQLTIKLTSGGAIAGIGLATTPSSSANATSSILVQADKFAIVPSSYSGGQNFNPSADKLPFGVDGSGIYMTGAVRIDGSLLVDGTITATKLNVTELSAVTSNLGTVVVDTSGYLRGGQTAYNTGTGFFLGYSSGAYKFSIGDPAGNHLTWDGSTLAITGALTLTNTIPYTQVTGLGTLATQDEITANDFASGITPVEIVASLPVSGNFTGRTVVLTTDKKLYRYDGTSFVASVAAADVTGQLTNSQIADLAAAKLTGQITTTQITDDAITTPKILAGAISTAKIAAGAVTANEIAANTITAAKIAAGTITATELATDSVIAGKIAAGAVTATKISVSSLSAVSAILGGVTIDTTGSLKGGQTGFDTGTGFFLGYDSGAYKFSVGNSSGNKFTWNGTTLTLVGNLSGVSTIDISGTAKFTGNNVSYGNAAVAADGTGANAIVGRTSQTTGTGIWGYNTVAGGAGVGVRGSTSETFSTGTGVLAETYGGYGLHATTGVSTGTAVYAENNSSTGVAIKLKGDIDFDSTKIGTGASTATDSSSDKPGSNSTNTWLKVLVGGTTYYIKAWPA